MVGDNAKITWKQESLYFVDTGGRSVLHRNIILTIGAQSSKGGKHIIIQF